MMSKEIVWLWDDEYPEEGVIPAEVPQTGEVLFEEDDWEDADFAPKINNKFPGWYLVKMIGFSSATMTPVEEWCRENVTLGRWEKVGWESGCSYSVGVVFEKPRDAMLFKLRWR
jgi:hypothetical protein